MHCWCKFNDSLGSIVHSPSLPSSFIIEAWAAGNCSYSPSPLIYATPLNHQNISFYFCFLADSAAHKYESFNLMRGCAQL